MSGKQDALQPIEQKSILFGGRGASGGRYRLRPDSADMRCAGNQLVRATTTDSASEGAFEISVEGHRQLKNLEASDSLRDNMTRMELIINMLGEETTATIATTEDAQGFAENQEAAEKGGKAAGTARKAVELETGQAVLSSDNYLPKQKQSKLLDDV